MSKCQVCEAGLKKDFLFCPLCGIQLNDVEVSKPQIDRTKYLWEREEKGRFIYKNFSSIREIGTPHSKKEFVRNELGDFTHADLFSLHVATLLFNFPLFFTEVFRAAKLIAHYASDIMLKTTGLDTQVDKINRRGEWWRVFEDKDISKSIKTIALEQKLCDIMSIDVDKDKKLVRYKLTGVPCSVRTPPPAKQCSLTFFLCGFCESLFDGQWMGEITKCESLSKTHCEIDIYLREDKSRDIKQDFLQTISSEIPGLFEKSREFADEEGSIMINNIKDRKSYRPRKKLGDFFHMSVLQCVSFLLIEPSPGHALLSKHSGIICGERITEAAGIEGADNALPYLEDLLRYLRAGILRHEDKGDRIAIKIDESAYASGVENIHMKLCIFLAGLIEGTLNQATREKWNVDETKCLANGDECCEFMAKRM